MSKRLAEGAVTTAQRREQRLGEAPTLAGKVVLVTGASSGIGRAIALACAEAGADLALTFRENRVGADEAAGTVRAAGRRVEVVRADVSRSEEHTSELQSLRHLVCRLLLEKKKKQQE